jgi:hypothetical protein
MKADTPARKSPATEQSVLMTRLQRIWSWLATPLPELTQTDATRYDAGDWYAGLPLDPHQFSNQLCQLQKSLRPEEPALEEAVPKKPVESMAIEFGSESAA